MKPIPPLGRYADRLLARFRFRGPASRAVPSGPRADVKHAPKGSAPRYVRRHAGQAGLRREMGRLVNGPVPATRRGRKARARIARIAERVTGREVR